MKDLTYFVKETDLPRSIVYMDFGWGNGYVGVPKSHPLFGVSYEAVDPYVDVHGGLSFSGMLDNLWCFGFDTAHSGDTLIWWTKNRVEEETILLKAQLESMSEGTIKKITNGISTR